jgi:hypothetical protein
LSLAGSRLGADRSDGPTVALQGNLTLLAANPEIAVIHSGKFKFFRFIDSGLKIACLIKQLSGRIATKRVLSCDKTGYQLRQNGWSIATKRVIRESVATKRVQAPFVAG